VTVARGERSVGLAPRPRLVAAALALATAGCSFVAVRRPKPIDDPTVADGCTRSPAAPIADTVAVVLAWGTTVTAGLISLTETSACGGSPDCADSDFGTLAAVGAGVTAATAASMVYGYVNTQRCRRNAELSGLCATGDRAACEELKPGWMPPPGWSPPPTWRSPPRTGAEPPAPDRE
jgi:hypothetical protein